MLSRRYWSLLAALSLLVLFGVTYRAPVQADSLLQGLPRLNGMNIYFTEAAGEASRFDRTNSGLSRFAGLLSQLGANLFTLEWRTGFPTDADLVVIAGPTSDLAPDQIARLWSYINHNGRVLLLADPILDPRRGALPSTSGLFDLMWADMGLRARDDVAVTEGTEPIYATPVPSADEAAATEESGASTEEAALEAAATPEVIGEQPVLVSEFTTGSVNSASPLTTDLGGDLAFFRARTLEVDASIQGFEVTPLIFTANNFYGESNFSQYLNNHTFRFDIGQDTTRGALPLAAAFNNENTNSRMIVIGDREFATNGGGLRTSPPNSGAFVYPANARFLLNAATWLLDRNPVSVEFPTPAPTATVTITPSPTPTRTPTPPPTTEADITAEATEGS